MIYSISEHAWTAGISWFNIRQNSRSGAIKATIRAIRHNRPSAHGHWRGGAINDKETSDRMSANNAKDTIHKKKSIVWRYETQLCT